MVIILVGFVVGLWSDMLEVFSCGKVPYPTIKASYTELLSEIRNGHTLDPPQNKACSENMYVMYVYW